MRCITSQSCSYPVILTKLGESRFRSNRLLKSQQCQESNSYCGTFYCTQQICCAFGMYEELVHDQNGRQSLNGPSHLVLESHLDVIVTGGIGELHFPHQSIALPWRLEYVGILTCFVVVFSSHFICYRSISPGYCLLYKYETNIQNL